MKLTLGERIRLTRIRVGLDQDVFYAGICSQQDGSYIEKNYAAFSAFRAAGDANNAIEQAKTEDSPIKKTKTFDEYSKCMNKPLDCVGINNNGLGKIDISVT